MEVDLQVISTPFTMEELEEVINRFEGNKSPGPDGYNFNFIQKILDLVKEEV